jgi:hypothetical protein
MNHSTIKTQIYSSASWYSAESILFNLWSSGVIGGHNRENISTSASMGEIFENPFKKPQSQKKVQIYWQGDLLDKWQ